MSNAEITSAAGICTLTMSYFKEPPVVSLENPVAPAEILCAASYHAVRQAVLRAHPWNFATRRVALTASSTAPAFGFTKQFALPGDFLRYLTRHDASGTRLSQKSHDYEIEDGFYLTNDTSDGTLRLRYVYDHVDVSQWDPIFKVYMSYELGLVLAPNFTSSEQTIERIKQLRDEWRTNAKATDGQERPPRLVQDSNWVRRRTSGTTSAGPFLRFPN